MCKNLLKELKGLGVEYIESKVGVIKRDNRTGKISYLTKLPSKEKLFLELIKR